MEFAVIASIMLLLFMGISVYWHALQAQQSVTRAAGDGARHIHGLLFSSRVQNIDLGNEAQTVVEQSLKQSGLAIDQLTSEELVNLVTVQQPESSQEIILTVTYPIQLLAGNSSSFMNLLGAPKQLQSQSVIQLVP